MIYQPDENRYHTMEYRRCGRSGVKLPAISLGLWHNFGDATRVENSRALLQRAFKYGHYPLLIPPIIMGRRRAPQNAILAAFCRKIFYRGAMS